MKSTLIIAVILGGVWTTDTALALDSNRFPGKGSRAVWNKACKVANEGDEIAKKDESAAIPKYEQAIAIYPYADYFYRDLGVSLQAKKNPDLHGAEAAFRKAIELDPKDWRNWNALATVLSDQKKYKECRDACRKALACNPPVSETGPLKKTILEVDEYLAKHK